MLGVLLSACSSTAPRAPRPEEPPRAAEPPALPDKIVLPASYRLVVLDGHLALVREADSTALEGAPTSLRVVSGEIARGEIAYQPGLLPQELAAEVAASRERDASMEAALASVMARSRELSEEALRMQAEARRLESALAERPSQGAQQTPPKGPNSQATQPPTTDPHALPE